MPEPRHLYDLGDRELSPLPPGSCVVVVPPEGSPEFEALVNRVEYWTLTRGDVRAALRALTGGDGNV